MQPEYHFCREYIGEGFLGVEFMSDVKRNVLCKAGRKKSSVVSSSSICRIISDELLAGLVAVDRQAAGTVKKKKIKNARAMPLKNLTSSWEVK